jgi:4-hydroxybenzoate polyprenyltransferase
MPPILKLLRPKQWTKGLLVFAALLFAAGFRDPILVARAGWAFLAITFVSAAVYVFNDLKDAEQDRLHPRKRLRPIAAGTVTPNTAKAVGAVALIGGFAATLPIGWNSTAVVSVYLAAQIAYNYGLKGVPVADVFLLASGFVLRAVLGAVAIGVVISPWLLFCTGTLSLMVGFGKRRQEFRMMGEDRAATRKSLEGYTAASLDAMFITAAAMAGLGFGIYSIDSDTAKAHPNLVATTIWVVYAIMRYVFLVFGRDEGGEPESILFSDRQLQVALVGFLATAIFAMTGGPQ